MTFRALPGAAVIGESAVAPETCVLQRFITTRKGAPISDTGHSILERSVVSVPAPETYAVTLDGLGFATWTVPLFAASQLCWHVLRQRYSTGTLLHEFTRVATDVLRVGTLTGTRISVARSSGVHQQSARQLVIHTVRSTVLWDLWLRAPDVPPQALLLLISRSRPTSTTLDTR